MDFQNKVVLVTGSATGVGRATALKFAELSAKLSLIDINGEELKNTATECEKISKQKVFTVIADLSIDREAKNAVEATIKQYEKIDVLINSIGIYGAGQILEENFIEVFDNTLAVNLRAIVVTTHFAAPALVRTKGVIINVSSVASCIPTPQLTPYAVTKAALNHFNKCIALDLAPKGVRVNTIQPGPVKTNIIVNSGRSKEKSDELFDFVKDQVPLKSLVNAKDIAKTIVFLASEEAKAITGADFVVDAGMMLTKCIQNIEFPQP